MNQDLRNTFYTNKNNKLYVFFLSIFFLSYFSYSQNIETYISDNKASISLIKKGKEIRVEAYIPQGITEFELRIDSDRNYPVSSARDIASSDPDPIFRDSMYQSSPLDVRYPIVDIELETGMDGICIFENEPKGEYIFGGPFFRESLPLSKVICLPSHKLEYWENSLMLDHETPNIERIYLRKVFPVILRNFRHTINLLSEEWSGKVSIAVNKNEKSIEIASAYIDKQQGLLEKAKVLEDMKGSELSRKRLINALDLLIQDGLRRQNNNPHSPTYGNLYAFYDLEAKTHRTNYWNWAGTQYVKMVVDAIKIPEIQKVYDTKELLHAVDKIGRNALRYQLKEENHPADGSFMVIWSRRFNRYTKWIGTSDSGVIVRWALIPLFEATGDSTYLEASKYWCLKKGEMLKEFEVLPHYYRYDENRFNDRILDETGWDPEGHAALYELTGDNRFREIGKEFMDKHMKVFQREDGLWHRAYDWTKQEHIETIKMTRGLGWAMEGLLAMNRMYPDTIYLDYAKKLAENLKNAQNQDGSWSFIFDENPKEVGVSEKGTALWSLLFYQLYEATGKSEYLNTARGALKWCLENQYTGPDVEAVGGLVGSTPASMVGIRQYFPASCAYTTGFFGMAILEELKYLGVK
ncbi:glycoside hydrolase family 88 protein [Litoribaculum gwangyangense]|uniref:Glycosyl hydrolase family 88 n=1 Tax=Litoribaculum gwangyangense TaxID=1130722 RepID=A0ABP9CV15_9FLAO